MMDWLRKTMSVTRRDKTRNEVTHHTRKVATKRDDSREDTERNTHKVEFLTCYENEWHHRLYHYGALQCHVEGTGILGRQQKWINSVKEDINVCILELRIATDLARSRSRWRNLVSILLPPTGWCTGEWTWRRM